MHHLAENFRLCVSSSIAGMAYKKNCVVQILVISRGEVSGPHLTYCVMLKLVIGLTYMYCALKEVQMEIC
jgi:hypothetical protein